MLLEKKIIFISDDLSSLTSAIMCMHCFIYPLVWQQPQIPIMSAEMEDYFYSPIPLIAGILRSELNKVKEEALDSLSKENDTMIVNIKSDKTGVEIDFKGGLLTFDVNTFSNLEHML